MALHRTTRPSPARHRFSGIRIFEVGIGCEVAFGRAFSSWPRLALRLQQRGHRVETALQKMRPVLITSANVEEIKDLLVSRAKRTRPIKLMVITAGVVSVALFLLISPASKTPPVQQKIAVKPNRCSEKVLDLALTHDELPSYVVQKQALKIGGVVTGEISCDEQRYSYTLDQGNTKRVLKLQKLDS